MESFTPGDEIVVPFLITATDGVIVDISDGDVMPRTTLGA